MIAIDKDSSILPVFWDLASPELGKRLEAAQTLVVTLATFQAQFKGKLGGRGGRPGSISFNEVLHGDVNYSLTRLIKGLSSPRESARQGFSLALTELLRLINFLPVKRLVELLNEHSRCGGSMKGEQARNMLFGRLFGLLAIARSGILVQPHVTSYLQESCSHLLLSLIAQAKGTKFEAELAPFLWEASVQTPIGFPDELAPLFALVSAFPMLEAKSKELELFKTPNLLDLAAILRDPGLPRLRLDPRFLGVSLSEFWKPVVDESLFSKRAGADRHFLGLQVVQYVLPRLNPDQLPVILTDNLCHRLLSILTEEDSLLTRSGEATEPSYGLLFVAKLYNFRARGLKNKPLPESTQKLISSILAALDEEGLLKFIDYLQDLFNGGAKLQGLSPEEAQRLVLAQLGQVVKVVKIKGSEAAFKRIVKFLTRRGLHSQPWELRLSERKVPQAIRQRCADQLSAILTGALKLGPLKADRKANQSTGLLINGDPWIGFTVGFIQTLEGSAKLANPLSPIGLKLKGHALKVLAEVEPHLSSEGAALSQAFRGMALLVQHLILEIYLGSEDLGVALHDIQTCFEHMANRAQPKGQDPPEPIDVLVDLLISFLSWPSSLMREMSGAVFAHLTGMIKQSTVELLLEVFTEAGEKNALMVEEDEIEELDSDALTEASDEADGEDDSALSDTSSDASNDDPVDPILLEKLKAALGPAAEVGSDDDLNDDQMLAFDEKLSMIFKERRAVATKKRGKAILSPLYRCLEAKLSMAQLKLKIADWFGLFVRLQPNSPLVVSLCTPLLTFAKEYYGSPTERALFAKLMAILNKDIHHHRPAKPEVGSLLALLQSAHEVSRKAPTAEIQRACQSICKMAVANLVKDPSKKTTKAIVETYRATLADYLARKKSSVSRDLFNGWIVSALPLSWNLVEDLLAAANLLEPVARTGHAIELLLKLFELTIRQKFDPNALLVNALQSLQVKAKALIPKLVESTELPKTLKGECLRDFFKLLGLTYRFDYVDQAKVHLASCPSNHCEHLNVLSPPTLDLAIQLRDLPRISSNQGLKTAIHLAIESSQTRLKPTSTPPGSKREPIQPSPQSQEAKG
ncbi:DNA-directed DNA polymerase [Massospora cicadina]|nr:DNA-directed DNA polymerase [Massospora cicadina]